MREIELMTESGYEKLKERLKISSDEREQALQEIAEAKKQGGELSENSEFIEAKDRFDKLENQIYKINERLRNARKIDLDEVVRDGKVRFGSVVKMVDLDTSEELSYQILGEDDMDIKIGVISYKSPIARAMIGKSIGDQVYFATPNGERELEILNVDEF